MRIVSEKDVYRCLDRVTTKSYIKIRDEIAIKLKIDNRKVSLQTIYHHLDNLERLGFVEYCVIKVSEPSNSAQSRFKHYSEYKLTQKGLENLG